MTSGISFRKLLARNLKKRVWLFVLMSAACAVMLPIRLYMMLSMRQQFFTIDNAGNYIREADRVSSLTSTAGSVLSSSLLMMACVIAAAGIAGVTGFAYLHSKEKVDFFHSFAIRREKYFFIPYLGGIIACIVPYLVCVAVSVFAVLPVFGIFSGVLAGAAFGTALDLIVYFFSIYSVVCLGMMLTGRVLIGILLSALILGYGPVCYELYGALMQISFDTYFATLSGRFGFYFSPVTVGLLGANKPFPGGILLLLILMGTAALVLTILLYRKRPSEAAEQPFAYRPMQSVIKVAATIPGAILGAFFFCGMFGYASGRAAYFLWALVSAVLINGVIEFIYSTDLKNILRHWKSALLILLAVAGLLIVFLIDPFGYDRYLPKRENVSAISVSPAQVISYLGDGYSDIYNVEGTKKFLDQAEAGNMDLLYRLAEEGRDFTNEVKVNASSTAETGRASFAVRYQLTSGRSVYRQYQIPVESLRQCCLALSESQEFRDSYYILDRYDTSRYSGIQVSRFGFLQNGYQNLSMGGDELRTFMDTLAKEAKDCPLAELKDSVPVAQFDFEWKEYEDWLEGLSGLDAENYLGQIYIYPEYRETVAYLEKKGIDLTEKASPLKDIRELNVFVEGGQYAVRDTGEIRELLAAMRPTRSYYADGDQGTTGSVEITFRDDYDGYVDFVVTDSDGFWKIIDGKDNLYA